MEDAKELIKDSGPGSEPTEPESEIQSEGWDNRPEGWEHVNYDYTHNILHLPDAVVFETPHARRDTDYEAIFVLAGGLNEENRNHQWVVRRLDLAVRFWQEGRDKKGVNMNKNSPQILCLGGGTYHKPSPRNHQGFVMHESTVCAQYLISRGIPYQQIMREWASYDTIANAWFALTNYALPFNYRRIALITSDFHMPRAKEIFIWLWNLAGRDALSELSFHSVTSEGLDPNIIEARRKREAKSLKTLTTTINQIKDLQGFAHWFYHEHRAYNCEVVGHESNFHRENDSCSFNSIDNVTRKSY